MKARLIPVSIILLVTILLLGGTWYFLYQSKALSKKTALTPDDILAAMVETEPITTNLNSGGYIQLRFQIQTSSKEAKDELDKRSFQVENIILRMASGITAEQARKPEENGQFEFQLENKLNGLLQNGKVVRVFTISKVIQ